MRPMDGRYAAQVADFLIGSLKLVRYAKPAGLAGMWVALGASHSVPWSVLSNP
jgi:hypothetical protein